MVTFPIKLLAGGYGASAAAAFLLALSGGGILLPVLIFWIGGAVCVLALGALSYRTRRARLPTPEDEEEDEDAAMAAELARWEEDRLADGASRTEEDRRGAAL